MASGVFGLMAIAQLVRLVIRPEVFVAGHLMPLWPSVLALIILGGLSLWMWKLARTPLPPPGTVEPSVSGITYRIDEQRHAITALLSY